jgi:hypothetical protein
MFIFICGYKGHGKDTLVDTLQNGGFYKYHLFVNSNFAVTDKKSGFSSEDIIDAIKKAQRIAFADALKNEIKERYNLDKIPITLAEKEIKNIVDRPHDHKGDSDGLKGGELVSFRDLCIKIALERRKEDPDYWVKKAIESRHPSTGDSASTGGNVVFTDWRFMNELSYFTSNNEKCITIRFFRANADIPSDNILSEHELDDFETNYIIVPFNFMIPDRFKNKYFYLSSF